MSFETVILEGSVSQDLKNVLDIRKKVFTLEQGIPSAVDDDGYDNGAIHVLGVCNGQPVASGRLVINNNFGVLARIAVLPDYRGKGFAEHIVKALENEGRRRNLNSFELYPHIYLEKFYSNLGYQVDPKYKNNVAGYDLIRMFK
ncbi:MAG TPA: GNAT family N-acetyltransferase [Fulvivirga sp.]|nr:GNAT family N-acetyltransferase [Fulvivirga sp.]